MALTGRQMRQLAEAMISAFPNRADFRRMLRLEADQSLARLVGDTEGLDVIVPIVIETAEARGWLDKLVEGAIVDNPGNRALKTFYGETWLAIKAPSRTTLESIIRQGNQFLDVDVWVDQLLQMSRRVCRVELDAPRGTAYGTGFLLAPDVVITNHHVMAPAIGGEMAVSSSNVRFRFDYRKLPDGAEAPGRVYALQPGDWLLDSSPPSAADTTMTPAAPPGADELDYALVRLERSPGEDFVTRIGADAVRRSYVPLAPDAAAAPGSPLFILQHPDSNPLKLAIDSDGVAEVEPTRIRYHTNTEGGSSGSPCFNQRWELLALHHRGDPRYPFLAPESNQGIPFNAILSLMRARGTDVHLGRT